MALLVIKVQKRPANASKAFLNAFEQTVETAGWTETQQTALFIPCSVAPAQRAIDTLLAGDVTDYKEVWAPILNTLNLSLEAYRRCLHVIEFGLDYHLRLIG